MANSLFSRRGPPQPSSTVYVRNIEERIKPETLVPTLHTLFSEFGTVLDVVAKRSLKRKGQAFVVFDSVEAAQRAIEDVQGFELFNKPLALEYARMPSDALVRLQGSEKDFEKHKRRRLAEKERRQALEAVEVQKKRAAAGVADPTAAVAQAGGATKSKLSGLKSTGPPAVIPDEYLPPNKTLFVQNIPDDYDVDSLSALFGRFEGFREVRLVPGRKGIAFVEYETESGSISAKERMANIPLGESSQLIKVTFQRS